MPLKKRAQARRAALLGHLQRSSRAIVHGLALTARVDMPLRRPRGLAHIPRHPKGASDETAPRSTQTGPSHDDAPNSSTSIPGHAEHRVMRTENLGYYPQETCPLDR